MNKQLAYSGAASWIEISAKALRHNIQVFKQISQQRFSIGVVLKGNAYGHDIKTVYPVVHSLVECVYLITPQDAFLIREIESSLGLAPKQLVVMGALTVEEILECSRQDIEMVLADPTWEHVISALRKDKLVSKVHIHLDTGLSREGFSVHTLENDLAFLKNAQDVISIKGAMSHFANTEDVTEQKYAHFQIQEFRDGVARLRSLFSLTQPLDEHLSASAAALVLPEAQMNRVRIGISLYGFWPSTETRISAKLVLKDLPQFQPVLSWKCKSQMIKKLPKGTYVGYGCTYRCDKESWIAVFPVGYFDGYPRLASGKAYILVDGRRCPVVGRIMMNHMIADVSQVILEDSDPESKLRKPLEAILIGTCEDETISAETLGRWSDTIQYEIVTRLGSHLKRILVE